MPECGKFAQTRGLCKAHGGGSRCRDPSCQKLAQSRGLCIAHGGGRRCAFDGCSKLAQSKGFCISHGGGRRCHVTNCVKFAQVRGHCKSHSKLLSSTEGAWSPSHSSTGSSSPRTTMSPAESKLSIDFLVNPSNKASELKQTALPSLHILGSVLPHQRPLLSYLDPMTTLASTASALCERRTMAHYPSLVMYR
ncbi:WRKY transcription factor 19 [Phytophthora cinnamomi]|uniref:WRKY transcription factor 19 n=1 Tax=Phytophthora cinnamomi TaxID=4785 RepID=UPI003559AAC7|nr:WRKY transcription factor 19 [Phytophthora cinnamomi]